MVQGSSSPAGLQPSRVAVVLYTERVGSSDCVLWSEGKLFRMQKPPKNFKPLSPLLVSSTFVGKFRAPAFFCKFEKPIFEAMDYPLPFIDGTFTRKSGTTNKVVFSYNPASLLGSDAKADFFLDSYPNIPLDVVVSAQFHCKLPRYNNSLEPPYPLIRDVKGTAGVPLPVPALNEKLLPQAFIRDLYSSPDLHFLAIFGAEENDYIPTFSIEDYWPIRDTPFTWPSLAAILVKKYQALHALKDGRSRVYELFVNRLKKHSTSKEQESSFTVRGGGSQGSPSPSALSPPRSAPSTRSL